GQEMDLEEIVREACGDEMFFVSSEGGVTISGGEPTYFPDFTSRLAQRLKEELVHVAVDTAACCAWPCLDELRPHVDLFLVDLKTMDAQKYREVIRGSLPVVQQNIERLVAAGASVRVRIPVIPGFNDTEDDFQAFADYLGNFRGHLAGVDILPYHSYAGKKYKLLGRWEAYQYREVESLHPEDVVGLARRLKRAGFSPADSSLTIGGIT
ncbi:MAG: glycyl-radical enzyme activating protein, partial [Firmicutes bacterium]|nr:glycyl-radical enzyme activating protein [Bacillota bacterium]